MHQQPPAVDQVVGAGFKLVLGDVDSADFDVFLVEILKEPCVDVGRDDRALRADAPAQPADDRTRASPDVQASPAILVLDR